MFTNIRTKYLHFWPLLLIMIFAAVLLVTLVLLKPSENVQDIEVQVNVFSGRPNPTWTTTASALGNLSLSALPHLPFTPTTYMQKSGYQGFVLTFFNVQSNTNVVAYVYKGVIRYQDSQGNFQYLADSIGLEDMLKRQAISQGYQAFLSL